MCPLGQKPRRYVDINFHTELDAPERPEIFALRLADLQSRPCPRGPATGWWSSLRGPIPVETQSRPGRSPSLATSPSKSAESIEQQLSTFIFDFSVPPLLSYFSYVLHCLACVLPSSPLIHSEWSSEGASWGEETRAPGPAPPNLTDWPWTNHPTLWVLLCSSVKWK